MCGCCIVMRICILNSFEDLMLRDTGPLVRIYNLAKHLASIGHEVHVVIPSGENRSKYVEGFLVHEISGLCPIICLRIFSKLLGLMRHTAILFYDFLFILRASRIILSCDLVQLEQAPAGGFIIPLLTKVFRKPLVVDCCDVFPMLRIGHIGMKEMLVTFLEKMAYRFADVVLAVSEKERDFLASYGVEQNIIKVIPNGVDTRVFKPLPATTHVRNRCDLKNKFTIVFVGNMEYLPNQEAVHAIATKIAPKIQKEISNAKFLIVGRTPGEMELPNLPDLTFTGVVPKVTEILAASDIAIAPLFHGTGTRLKILEYFASGLPVVSTTVGAEGLDVEDGVNVVIADDMDKFVMKMIELLKDKSLSKKLGKAARELVTKRYDWHKIAEALNSVYLTLH